MQLTTERLAYIAGVVDVRGYLTTRVSSASVLPVLSVSLRDSPLTAKLCAWTEVKPVVYRRDHHRSGCAEHCPEPHVHVQSEWERWVVTGGKCLVVLRALLPYLEVQRGRAEELIELGQSVAAKPATVRRMSQLGWPVALSVVS